MRANEIGDCSRVFGSVPFWTRASLMVEALSRAGCVLGCLVVVELLARQQWEPPHSQQTIQRNLVLRKQPDSKIIFAWCLSDLHHRPLQDQERAFPTRSWSVYGQLRKKTPFPDTLTPIKIRFQTSLPEKHETKVWGRSQVSCLQY